MNLKTKLITSIFIFGSVLATNVFAMEGDESRFDKGFIAISKKDSDKPAQITDTVVMIYPDHFEYNIETSHTNAFQNDIKDFDTKEKALKEFTDMVEILKENDIHVLTLKSKEDKTPDAVFPNNWFLTLKDNENMSIVLFPMLNNIRRLERQEDNLKTLLSSNNIKPTKILDLTYFEKSGKALEGTGSLVLDRQNKIAYGSISPRTNKEVLEEFSKISGYKSITFQSQDKDNKLIYHTNVMMSIGDGFAVVCLASITQQQEREEVLNSLKMANKTIIPISLDQVHSMCGNILQVKNSKGDKKIIMSKTAFEAFKKNKQLQDIEKFGKIVSVEIPTIETIGGGSSRCMLAEIFH